MAAREAPQPVWAPARESVADHVLVAGALMVVNLAARILVQFAGAWLAARYLAPPAFGLWIILQSTAMWVGLSELGLAQTVANQMGRAYTRGDRAGLDRVLATAFVLYWGIVLPVGAVLLLAVLIFPLDTWLLRDVPTSLVGLSRVAVPLMLVLTLGRIPPTVFP